MTKDELNVIKAHHRFADIDPLVAEIERLRELVKSAFREGGQVDYGDLFDEDNYCWDHSKARKALEVEE